jgi:bifunctional N-acetylglucosamine-1-phosphate-uridyltransferase/glucosamine-1-phosphate-acetyltransferase GlmU-like protein
MKRLLRTIIPAAGAGARMGLSYPKTLYSVAGAPILGHILSKVADLTDEVVVVVSPSGDAPVQAFLSSWHKISVSTAVQHTPIGMADAVRKGINAFGPDNKYCDYLIIWGDQVTVHRETLEKVLLRHHATGAWLTFPTSFRRKPYIHVQRDEGGRVSDILELREGDVLPDVGENDCGVFVARGEVLAHGIEELEAATWDERFSRYKRLNDRTSTTGEFNFLPLIGLWSCQGRLIEALPIACEFETYGINTPDEAERIAGLIH